MPQPPKRLAQFLVARLWMGLDVAENEVDKVAVLGWTSTAGGPRRGSAQTAGGYSVVPGTEAW